MGLTFPFISVVVDCTGRGFLPYKCFRQVKPHIKSQKILFSSRNPSVRSNERQGQNVTPPIRIFYFYHIAQKQGEKAVGNDGALLEIFDYILPYNPF